MFQESYAAIMRYCRAPDGFGVRDWVVERRGVNTFPSSIEARAYTR